MRYLHLRFHSSQEDLRRFHGFRYPSKHSKFPFLTGRFKTNYDVITMIRADLFPFLTGRFKTLFQEYDLPKYNEFPFLTGRFKTKCELITKEGVTVFPFLTGRFKTAAAAMAAAGGRYSFHSSQEDLRLLFRAPLFYRPWVSIPHRKI